MILKNTQQQIDKIVYFVRDNGAKLSEQFCKKYIAVEYRDVRGGIVVDSDVDEKKLAKRLEENRYGDVIVGTVGDFVTDSSDLLKRFGEWNL